MDDLWLDALLGPEDEDLAVQTMEVDELWSQYIADFDKHQAAQAMSVPGIPNPPTQPLVVATGLQASAGPQAASTLTAAATRAPFPVTTGFAGLEQQASTVATAVKSARPLPLTSDSGSAQSQAPGVAKESGLIRSHTFEYCPLDDSLLGRKEKNKRAQKRFREKQKARLHDSEVKAAEYSGRLAKLEAEKAQLENRLVLMEKLVQMKMDAPVESGSVNLQLGSGQEHCCRSLLMKMANEDKSLMKACSVASMANTATVTLRLENGREVALTPDFAKQMTWPELSGLYRDYVKRVGSLLISANDQLESPAGEELKQAVKETFLLLAFTSIMNPRLLRTLQSTRLDDEPGGDVGATNMQSLQKLLHSLNLQPPQCTEMLNMRNFYLTKLGEVLRERERILSSMHVTSPEPVSSVPVALGYMQTMDTVEDLNKNLREEHLLQVQLCSTVWGKILLPVQVANLMVQAYPMVPDLLALVECLVPGTAEAPAAQLLAMGSSILSADTVNTSGSGC